MHTAYQPVLEVLGDSLALPTRRECGVWALHDANIDILATAKRRFKVSPHVNHSMSQAGLSVRSLIGILGNGAGNGATHHWRWPIGSRFLLTEVSPLPDTMGGPVLLVLLRSM
jgi:hypothetical protein